MKRFQYKSLVMLLAVSLFGCGDFLNEENRSSISIETASSNAATFDQMVMRVYELSREHTTYYTSDMHYTLEDLGTDIVTRGSLIIGTDEINDYVNMSPSNWVYQVYWANQYSIIAAANTAIDNADAIKGVGDATKTSGIAQVKFFRAWAYFNLVENYGDVPLVLNQVTTAQSGYGRASEEEIYAQILVDLTDALAGVDENPSAFGLVSKDAVSHLTSKVLLTRGYKSFGSSNDFTQAASLAETVIANHPLESSFASLVDIDNERNNEVIFSYLFGDNVTSRGWGNSRHMLYKFEFFNYPGMTRGNTYQRGLGPAPTPFFYSLFEDGDERADATFRHVIYAEVDSEDGSILAGDTAIYFPETAWNQTTIDSKPYTVVNPGTYFVNDGTTDVHYPMFKKFDNPGVAFKMANEGAEGTRDMVMMRGGEAYLIAAEAYLQLGNTSTAAARLATLRSRAGLTAVVGDVDIDFILDERARELVGEVNRWMDLKRTGKLIERVLAHNPHAALSNALTTKNLVRPIPQYEIDATSGSIAQNPNY
jgi:starch-binding outer membrane protein, SusD/RagB family